MPSEKPQSILQQIRTRALNKTVGPWVRAIDLILSEYEPRSRDPEDEADYVTKLSLLLMLTRFYEEEQICLLLDSTQLALPKKLKKTTRTELKRLLDRPPSDSGYVYDDDAPPGSDDTTCPDG